MEKIDWRRKLASRKFWMAIAGFITAWMAYFGMAESEIAQVTSIVMAGAVCIGFIIGESNVDAANKDNITSIMDEDGNIYIPIKKK